MSPLYSLPFPRRYGHLIKLLAGLLTAAMVVTALRVLAVRADPDVPLSLSGADARIRYCTTYEPVIVTDLTSKTLST